MKKTIVIIILMFVLQANIFTDISPKTAVLASIFIPGGGQLYTGRTKRAVFFSIIQGTLISSTIYSHFKYKQYLNQYHKFGLYNDSFRYKGFYNLRNNLLWWDALIISISAIDAYVGAKMYGFYEKTNMGDNRLNIGFEYNW